jgi:hypothetical protein
MAINSNTNQLRLRIFAVPDTNMNFFVDQYPAKAAYSSNELL